RTTSLSYESGTFPLQVTRIADPFGRSAQIAYDDKGRVASITDVVGLVSSFTYDKGDFVKTLTTPYGTSHFSYSENGANRTLDMRDALGQDEHLEFAHTAPGIGDTDPRGSPAGMNADNSFLNYRNTFYWSKQAWKAFPGDYTKARIRHWYHDYRNF